MQSILEELYYGNVCAKDIVPSEKIRKKELALYDKLKATLSDESDRLFEEFIEMNADDQSELMLKIYKRGVSTGMLLAFEAFCEGGKQ